MNKNTIAKAAVGGAEGSTSAAHNVGLNKHRIPDDGLSTDHSSHPPFRSGRSAGRFNPSDLPATPVSGGRQNRPVRRLRTLSLPASGAAAGLLAVFLAMPVLWAQAQDPSWVEVWSATVTVGVKASSRENPDMTFTTYGYDAARSARASGSINNDGFRLNGMDYAISRLAYWTRSSSSISPAHQQLSIVAGNELPTGSVFDLDGRRFTVTSHSRYYSATPGRHEWDNPGLNWSDGDEVAVRLLVPTLTANAVGGSAFHDGSSLFRVRVRFGKLLQNNAEEVARAFAAETTGGTITEARCVWRADGMESEGEEWDIYVKPDGDGDVTLGLATGGQCDLPGQICSKDALRVGNWLHEVRSGSWIKAWANRTIPFLTNGVTATVTDSPDSHDGSSPFDVRVRFNAELHNSYLRIMRAFEGTTGGTVVRTRPVPRRDGTHDGALWDITVQPDGAGDVTLALRTGGPCQEVDQPCSKDWKWITAAHDFPLTISGHRDATDRVASGQRAPARPSPSWAIRAGRR